MPLEAASPHPTPNLDLPDSLIHFLFLGSRVLHPILDTLGHLSLHAGLQTRHPTLANMLCYLQIYIQHGLCDCPMLNSSEEAIL